MLNPNRKFILYPHASWFFALGMVVTWIGFSKSYFSKLPQTDIYHHLHGATAGAWFLILIIQPLLYKRNQLEWHRRLGKTAVYILMPLLLLGGIKMTYMELNNQDNYPLGAAYIFSFLDFWSLILFPVFVWLSLKNVKKIHLHARYMACTVLLLLPPAITRALFFIPWFDSLSKALNGSFFIVEAILIFLFVDDYRTGGIRRPYMLALAFFVFLHITLNLVSGWAWWKYLMDGFARW